MLRTTLRQLEIFVAIAQVGTATEAAELMGLTQSAASMALGELERQLNVKLFDRHSRRLIVNENGRLIYHKAMEIIDRARELEDIVGPGRNVASLRLGASSTIGNYMMPQIMGEFMAERPGSRFSLEVGNTQTIVSAVAKYEIDIGFIEGPNHGKDVTVIPWQEEELVICAAPDHPLAKMSKIQAKDLAKVDWVLRERGSGTREVMEGLLMAELGIIQIVMELGNTEAVKRAVESGLGISCLPKIAINGARERGALICLSTPSLNLKRQLFIVMHKNKYQTKGIREFLAHCRQVA